MAHRLRISPAFFGLQTIYNVDTKVGWRDDCANAPTDVELLTLLIHLGPGTSSKAATFIKRVGLPPIGGQYTALVGLWIYHIQDKFDDANQGQARPDGVVGKAGATGRYPGGFYTITGLNKLAQERSPQPYANLAAYPGISSALKAQLSK